MINNPPSAQAPLLAELRYFDFARELWPRLLMRARQLGANTLAAPVPWAWHVPAPDLIDFDGRSDPRRDLLGFVTLSGQLGLTVILDFSSVANQNLLARGTPPWLAATPRADHTLDPGRQNGAANLTFGQQWVAACTAALLPHQFPHGPIAGLRVPGDDPGLYDSLRQAGWAVSLDWPRAREQTASYPPAALLAEIGYLGNLAGSWPLRNTDRQPPTLLRSDMSARPGFWRAKTIRMLLGAAGEDFATARAPADLALVTHAHAGPLAALAKGLAGAGITFDQIDLATTTAEHMQRYALVIAGEPTAGEPAAREKLDGCANLAIAGATAALPAQAQRLADAISADQISELIETGGGIARYAWADSSGITISVRYGANYTYLFANNHNDTAYNGMLAYRAPDGAVLHLHLGIGAGRSGAVMLREDEVVGAAIDGDGAESGWLARGLQSSMMFNSGSGAVAPCGSGLLLTAPQSGRFQLRRGAGWADLNAYRLLLSGKLLPVQRQTDAAHLSLPYTAEDDAGQTDMYLMLPDNSQLPSELRAYLSALLRARSAEVEAAEQAIRAAQLPQLQPAARACAAAAELLARQTEQFATIGQYAEAWRNAAELLEPAVTALVQARPSKQDRARDQPEAVAKQLAWAAELLGS